MEEKFYVWGNKCIPDELIRSASTNAKLNVLAGIVASKYDEFEWAVEVKIECEKLITIGIKDDYILGHIRKSDIDTLNIAKKHFTDSQWDLFVHTVNWADVEKAK